MDDFKSSSLCRICLQDGAILPIFGKSEGGINVHNKLCFCLQCEEIEDVVGYPRNICTPCNTTLESLFNFIIKYRESNKILENGLKVIKKETNYNDDCEIPSETELEIKYEPDNHFEIFFDNDSDELDEKPLKILKDIKREGIKQEDVKKEVKLRKKIKGRKEGVARTNKIASAILEGDFVWNGDKWCMKIGQTTLKRLRNTAESKPRPQTKVKVPHITTKKSEQKLCDLCGIVFNNRDRLNVHKKNVHFKTPVKCPKCPQICVSEYYLKRHVKRKHELNRDFICSTCGHGFVYKGELMNHCRKVHNKDMHPKKTYACKFCDKTYKCQKSIIIHERSVHTGQRPAQCSVCGSSFYHEDYLKEHMRLHTGETPFKCPICGRGYAQRGNMKSHLRIHRISELDAVTLSKIKPNYLKLLKA